MALFAAHKISLLFLSEGVLSEASPTQPKLQPFIFPMSIIPQYVPIQQAILFTQVNKRSILYSNLCCKVCTYITVAATKCFKLPYLLDQLAFPPLRQNTLNYFDLLH